MVESYRWRCHSCKGTREKELESTRVSWNISSDQSSHGNVFATCLIYSCRTNTSKFYKAIQSAAPVDDYPGPMGWLCDDDHIEEDHANRLSVLSLGLPGVYRRTKQLASQPSRPEKDSELIELVKRAQEVDAQLEDWHLNLPDTWGCRTIAIQTEPDDPYSSPRWTGPVQVYEDIFVASTVNEYRINRLFCQKSILLAISALSARQAETKEHVRKAAIYTACAMADSICSNVPFHLDMLLQSESARASGQEVRGELILMILVQGANQEQHFSC